jgi:AraC family transcriptional regulator, regulatory protein of adaptative response / methylated-DNA-[protein]-cysteine methyltransferase
MNTMTLDHGIAAQKAKKSQYSTDGEKLAAMRRHDPAADGHFFCAIATTGIYCYPSCASRPAKVENITFYGSRDEAVQAGYRSCKRCRSELAPRAEREAAMIAAACRTIEGAEEPPLLADLAAAAGVSPHHFHRVFKRIAGVTPKGYADAQRQERVQDNLSTGSNVTEGLYAAGFNSSSRFYEASEKMLGMTPTAYRNGGAGEAIWHAVDRCSLGRVLVAATGRGVCAILLGDDPAALRTELAERFPKAHLADPEPSFSEWVAEVVRFVDDPSGDGFALPLDIRGTAFQRRVWEVLREIPAGATVSYSEVAERMGSPKAARAVATACASNKIAVAIPCHRVVRTSGALSGYRWGLERKRQLLECEKA